MNVPCQDTLNPIFQSSTRDSKKSTESRLSGSYSSRLKKTNLDKFDA